VRALAGRRIVITRAPQQSEQLNRRLTAMGANVVSMPMVRFVDPVDAVPFDAAIETLAAFDWVLFTSANSVHFFVSRCRALGRWPIPPGLHVAAVGPATQSSLEAAGLHVEFVPRRFSGADLAAELAPKLAGKRVLLPRGDRASPELPDHLRNAGAVVTDVVAYRTVEPDSLNAKPLDPKALNMIRAGESDAVVFFSPSAFHNFARVLGRDALSGLAEKLTLAAVGPVTAAAIRDSGLQVAVEAAEATSESLISALDDYFARRLATRPVSDRFFDKGSE